MKTLKINILLAGSLALLLGAAYLIQPRTMASAQAPAPVFTVRGYGGKCLEFGPLPGLTLGGGAPVYIADCNGSAAQRVGVEELPGPGHRVILRAGNGVIGAQRDIPIKQAASAYSQPGGTREEDDSATPSALAATAAAALVPDQTSLEVRPFSNGHDQIFALDGDSIMLAADRNMVVEVRGNRGANQTRLVLGRRDLDDSEFWSFTATDGSARRPTSGFVRISQAAGEWYARAVFLSALRNAAWGTVIELDQNVSLDLSGQPRLEIPAGVTIRGDRHGTRPGPELRCANAPDNMMITTTGNATRITGLRLTGPTTGKDSDALLVWGILLSSEFTSIVDHNELSAWTQAAVEATAPGVWDQNNSRPENIRIERNFFHHNRRGGYGYGVATGGGGYATIKGNTFVENRHAISGDGSEASGYRAWYNLVLDNTPDYGILKGGRQQDFDMHGSGDRGRGGRAGHFIEIGRNTFLGSGRQNFYLRGTPTYLADFRQNILVQSYSDAVASHSDPSKFKVYSDNQFNAPNPARKLGVGDFDGDGNEDLFLATGAAWYYAPAGQTEWRFLNARTEKIEQLLFGDFDGDRRADVFTQHNEKQWDVSWGGASPWETINGSGPLLGQAAIGDFNGDGRDDVFYADGAQWYVSYSGTGMFTHIASAVHGVPDLRFGDFNGDRKTDVFGVVGDEWMAVYGGTNHWAPLQPKLTDGVANLIVADFNGDGRDDLAGSFGLYWKVSHGGTGALRILLRTILPLASTTAIGRFDGDAKADVLAWHDNYLDIAPGGAGAFARHGITDLR